MAGAAQLLVFAGAASGESAARQLSASELRRLVVGHTVTDDSHWADSFFQDGRVEGHSLGRKYSGKWRIEDGQMCVERGTPGRPEECFEVWLSKRTVEYRRGGAVLAEGRLRGR